MTSRKTAANDGRNTGAPGEEPSSVATHPDGPLFAVRQAEAASATEDPSPHPPWDELGEPQPGNQGEPETGQTDDLPAAGELFEPAAANSAEAGEAPRSRRDRLNGSIDQLLETVDAVAADVAESRSHLERLTRSAPDDPEAANGAGGIEDRIRVHTADFHRWIEGDRRRRRWWPAVVAGVGVPVALLLGLLVEQQYQVIPLHDPTGGWRGHIWEQYGRRIVDCAVEARRTGAEVNCPLVVRRP